MIIEEVTGGGVSLLTESGLNERAINDSSPSGRSYYICAEYDGVDSNLISYLYLLMDIRINFGTQIDTIAGVQDNILIIDFNVYEINEPFTTSTTGPQFDSLAKTLIVTSDIDYSYNDTNDGQGMGAVEEKGGTKNILPSSSNYGVLATIDKTFTGKSPNFGTSEFIASIFTE